MPAQTPSSKKKKPAAKKSSPKKWVKTVNTDSTHPPKELFTKSASTIARSLASRKVSPKGPGSGMRMLTYFINRAGKGLSASRRKELERAKHMLHERIEKGNSASTNTAA
ncbi:MAG TPA: DUF3175 domain-containing protein [Acidobacteriaceae bacterium]|jgi:hypothetical protein|nr:DUF3175 domain-containing protein [Acidobacteriaceae bacterium]